MMWLVRCVVILFGLIGGDATVHAQGKVATLEVGVGAVGGTAREFVYDPSGATLSRLDWKTDNVTVVTATGIWSPVRRFTFIAKGRLNVTDPGSLVDQDWVAGCLGGLCRSDHPDTRVSTLTGLDVSGVYHAVRLPTLSLGVTAGYRFDYTKWQAYAGTANYATLPPGLAITYEQKWEAPYAGLAAAWALGRWSASARVVGSVWGSGRDDDVHHLRSLRFEQTYGEVRMIAAGGRLTYDLTELITVAAEYEWQSWRLAKSAALVTDLSTGAVGMSAQDGAGADSRTQMLALSLGYRF